MGEDLDGGERGSLCNSSPSLKMVLRGILNANLKDKIKC